MKISVPALALLLAQLLLAGEALGADRHKPDVDPESEDGILLQRIQQEPTQPVSYTHLDVYKRQDLCSRARPAAGPVVASK